MNEAIRKELQESLEEMLKLFSPFAAAFRDGKGLEVCTKAESTLAKAKEETPNK
jgi:hypothetical protein